MGDGEAVARPLVADSPAEALSELDGLVERMMVANGNPVDEEHEFEASEAEIVKEFREACRIARLVDGWFAQPPPQGDRSRVGRTCP